jgi:hypothetical protein
VCAERGRFSPESWVCMVCEQRGPASAAGWWGGRNGRLAALTGMVGSDRLLADFAQPLPSLSLLPLRPCSALPSHPHGRAGCVVVGTPSERVLVETALLTPPPTAPPHHCTARAGTHTHTHACTHTHTLLRIRTPRPSRWGHCAPPPPAAHHGFCYAMWMPQLMALEERTPLFTLLTMDSAMQHGCRNLRHWRRGRPYSRC